MRNVTMIDARQLLGLTLLLGLALPVSAQEPFDSLTRPLEPDASIEDSTDAESPLTPSSPPEPDLSGQASTALPITLTELINLALAGNRGLRGNLLDRIIQRQELSEAEQRFNPRLTPEISGTVDQDFSGSREENSTFSDRAALSAEILTRLGSTLELSVDPLADNQIVTFNVTQPLLRGFGPRLNEVPIEQARLTETSNQLQLRQSAIDTITTSITSYTGLIQAQEQVAIQEQALERRQQELERQEALVEAGRQARASLSETQRSVAEAERDLSNARRDRVQANTALLNLIGSDDDIVFEASREVVNQLFNAAVARVQDYNPQSLIEAAFQRSVEFRQAQLTQEGNRLNQLVAEDNRRWELNLTGRGNLGDFSDGSMGLVATRTFGDPSLETALVQSRVTLQQGENTLASLQESIRNNVTTELNTVRSNLDAIEAARRARESAERQLDLSQAQFERGSINLFELTTQEDNLVNAQNAELDAEINFLNSIAQLESTVGITLERWQANIDLGPLEGEIEVEAGEGEDAE